MRGSYNQEGGTSLSKKGRRKCQDRVYRGGGGGGLRSLIF